LTTLNISIEEESPEDTYETTNNLSTVEKLNTAQLNTDPETGDEWLDAAIPTNHSYNLRPRPTLRNKKYTMTQSGQQSTNHKLPKPHVHILMMQQNVREGIKNKGIR